MEGPVRPVRPKRRESDDWGASRRRPSEARYAPCILTVKMVSSSANDTPLCMENRVCLRSGWIPRVVAFLLVPSRSCRVLSFSDSVSSVAIALAVSLLSRLVSLSRTIVSFRLVIVFSYLFSRLVFSSSQSSSRLVSFLHLVLSLSLILWSLGLGPILVTLFRPRTVSCLVSFLVSSCIMSPSRLVHLLRLVIFSPSSRNIILVSRLSVSPWFLHLIHGLARIRTHSHFHYIPVSLFVSTRFGMIRIIL